MPTNNMLYVCTLTVPDTSEGHLLLLGLRESGIRLYHTGQTLPGMFNLYAQFHASQWKRLVRILPAWVSHNEKRAQAMKREIPLLLQELRWDFKEGEYAASYRAIEDFAEKFSHPYRESATQVRLAISTVKDVLALANTPMCYIPINSDDRHTATQWLRRHHIPYAITHITQETLFRFAEEERIHQQAQQFKASKSDHQSRA